MTGFTEISQNEMMAVDGGEWTDDSGTTIGPPPTLLIMEIVYDIGYAAGKWLAGLFN